jgi:hypothetical protein
MNRKTRLNVLLRFDSEFEFNVAKPMTRPHGYRFFGGKNFSACTCTCDQNLQETCRFTLTCADHYRHTMPDNDKETQMQMEEAFGVRPCLWQIKVVCKILAQDDVITINVLQPALGNPQ